MAKFNLSWDNSTITGNPNVTSQEANTKPKTSSTWVTAGFTTYPNPIAVDKNISTSPDLPDNIIHQFKVNAICTLGGPMPNLGGVAEVIHFGCIIPILTNTGLTATASINLAGTAIKKVRFTLRRQAGGAPAPTDPIILVPTVVVRDSVTNLAAITVTGLSYTTNYYWETELYTTLRNGGVDLEVISSQAEYIGSNCITIFTTIAAPSCAAVTSLTVTSAG